MGWDIVVYAGSVLGRLQFGLMAVSDFLMPLARVRIPIPMPIFAALLVAGLFGYIAGRFDEEGKTGKIIAIVGLVVAIFVARAVHSAGYPYWPYGEPEPTRAVRFIKPSMSDQYDEYPIKVVCTGDDGADSFLGPLNNLAGQCESMNAPTGHTGTFRDCVKDPLPPSAGVFLDKHYFICKK